MSIGIYHRSRVSALLLLVYYLISKIILIYESGSFKGGLISIIISILLSQAALAPFKYHAIRKQHEPDYRATSKFTWWLATPIHTVLGVILLFAVLGQFVHTVPNTAIRGSQVEPAYLDILVDNWIIEPDERVELFFSEGFLSIIEGGNLITNMRVISYETIDGELYVHSALFSEVAYTSIETKGSEVQYSQIYVETHSGNSFYLFAPHEEKEDEPFGLEDLVLFLATLVRLGV